MTPKKKFSFFGVAGIPPDLTKGEASEKIEELKKVDLRTAG
jgi:hypothetical protein